MYLRNAIAMPLIAAFCLAPVVQAGDSDTPAKNVVYVHTNNPGQNSVLAFKRNPGNGELTPLPGNPFLTGGAGFRNGLEVLGPDDTDQELVATPDGRFLYVTNEGSNTITGFAVQADGSLVPVPGSPFPSGGVQPGSIGIDGYLLFVANRGDQNPGGLGGNNPPVYASFVILPEGSLIRIPVSQPAIVAGSSPTQALISPDGKLMFDAHLFEYSYTLPGGNPPFIPQFATELHSYKITPFGQLIPASQTAPGGGLPPYILGLQVHPTQKILYAGLVVASLLATYTYDDNGNMTLVSTTPAGNAEFPNPPGDGLCWVAISPDAKWLYSAGAVTNQIDVYSIAKDPLHPVHIQTVDLKGVKTAENFPFTGTDFDTTPFQLKTSPDGKFLFVVSHDIADIATGNTLHTLKIAGNGLLTENADSPRLLMNDGVLGTAHPLGVVVF